jgi:hypothetical protein
MQAMQIQEPLDKSGAKTLVAPVLVVAAIFVALNLITMVI